MPSFFSLSIRLIFMRDIASLLPPLSPHDLLVLSISTD